MDKQEAEILVSQFFSWYGLAGWKFRWNKNKQRLGLCRYDTRTIELSEVYVANNSREHVLDTVLHEVAHAIAGPRAGHGPEWKEIAQRVGASPRSCTRDVTMPQGHWQARCRSCGTVFMNHKRPKHLATSYCLRCGPDNGKLKFKNVARELNLESSSRRVKVSQMAIEFPK